MLKSEDAEIGIVENEICVKTYEEAHIEWKIADFFSVIEDENYQRRFSPVFFFANHSWFLELLNQSDDYPGSMILYVCSQASIAYSVEYHCGLKKLDGSVNPILSGIMDRRSIWSAHQPFIDLSELLQVKSKLAPSNVLTITCTLRREIEIPNSTQPNVLNKPKLEKLIKLETLSENFRDLFANKESCDTTLRVKDKEYKAHKAVLIARSSVFAAMFLHEMSEKETGIITIPDCDPDSFKEFLEFLYCGQLEELSLCSVFHLYETSDKYDVQDLKTFCIEFLIENFTVENFCEIVIMADKYQDTKLNSAIQDFFNENLNDIFQTSKWESLMKKNFRLASKLLKEMPKVKVAK